MATLDEIDDAVAAKAFRRLVRHLRQRSDAQNVDLMGLAGFCRNCLGDWLAEASGGSLSKDAARDAVYGMSYADWKAQHHADASPEQLARMEASLARNKAEAQLDAALAATFPASDPPAMIRP